MEPRRTHNVLHDILHAMVSHKDELAQFYYDEYKLLQLPMDHTSTLVFCVIDALLVKFLVPEVPDSGLYDLLTTKSKHGYVFEILLDWVQESLVCDICLLKEAFYSRVGSSSSPSRACQEAVLEDQYRSSKSREILELIDNETTTHGCRVPKGFCEEICDRCLNKSVQ